MDALTHISIKEVLYIILIKGVLKYVLRYDQWIYANYQNYPKLLNIFYGPMSLN